MTAPKLFASQTIGNAEVNERVVRGATFLCMLRLPTNGHADAARARVKELGADLNAIDSALVENFGADVRAQRIVAEGHQLISFGRVKERNLWRSLNEQ